MDTTISMESLEKFEKNFDANRANAMAMNASSCQWRKCFREKLRDREKDHL